MISVVKKGWRRDELSLCHYVSIRVIGDVKIVKVFSHYGGSSWCSECVCVRERQREKERPDTGYWGTCEAMGQRIFWKPHG